MSEKISLDSSDIKESFTNGLRIALREIFSTGLQDSYKSEK